MHSGSRTRGFMELELFCLLFPHLFLSSLLQSGLVSCCLCGSYRGFLQHFSNKVGITVSLHNEFQLSQTIHLRSGVATFLPVAV